MKTRLSNFLLAIISIGILFGVIECVNLVRTWTDGPDELAIDGELGISIGEKKRALSLRSYVPQFLLTIHILGTAVEVEVVEDTRTGVFGFCNSNAIPWNGRRIIVGGENDFKLVKLNSDSTWVNMRRNFAYSFRVKE